MSLSQVWVLCWVVSALLHGLVLPQASPGMLPQQRRKSGWKCRNTWSCCLSHICSLSLGHSRSRDRAQSQKMGQNTPPRHTHTQWGRGQSYIVKGLGSGRGEELSSSVHQSLIYPEEHAKTDHREGERKIMREIKSTERKARITHKTSNLKDIKWHLPLWAFYIQRNTNSHLSLLTTLKSHLLWMHPDMPSEDSFPVILLQDPNIAGTTYPHKNKWKIV